MPFPKTGSCPFPGEHWPSKWGEEKITAKSFSCLNSDQKQDLIEYIGEHDLAIQATVAMGFNPILLSDCLTMEPDFGPNN